jgi:two-component system nitrogen regulation sensor histidine kinase GlnL
MGLAVKDARKDARRDARAERRAPAKDGLGAPLCKLSDAIVDLQQACDQLRTSVGGINLDLEEKNEHLKSALLAHCETLAYVENILANIPNGVIVVDRHGKVVLLNGAAEAITGFTGAEAEGESYAKIFGRGVQEKSTPLYTLATGSPIVQGEKVFNTKSGKNVPVSYSTSLIVDGGNEICGAVEVLTDLTKLKLLEEEVSRTRALATIGEVAAMVAHEIRNPLGGIKGFASLLKRDLASKPGSLALVEKISEGIDTLEKIVSDLLTAGRPLRLEPERTEFTREVKRLVEMFELAAGGESRRVRFETSFTEEPLYCRVDVERMRQALTNLFRNAVDAVDEEGMVTVSLTTKHCGTPEGPIGHMSGPAREYLRIEVADTGPGIPDDVLERIFSPFFTTKRDGSGLGLANVRKIAALHGGEVKYERGKSGGSRFIMEIPRW